MPESFGEQAERPLLGIDFVFEMGMKKIEEQVKEIDALDLKIAVLFGFLGTVLVALLAVVFAAEQHRTNDLADWLGLFLLLVGVLFTGVAIFNAFQGFRIRQYSGSPRFEDLFRWADKDPKQTKYAFLNTLLTAVNDNNIRIGGKHSYANRASWFVFLGFLSFLFAIIAVGTRIFVGK